MKLKSAYSQRMVLTRTGIKFCLLMLILLFCCSIAINTASAKILNQSSPLNTSRTSNTLCTDINIEHPKIITDLTQTVALNANTDSSNYLQTTEYAYVFKGVTEI